MGRTFFIGCMLMASVSFAGKPPAPGATPYQPTKIQWAAVEMQALYGNKLPDENHVTTLFFPDTDGVTVVCALNFEGELSEYFRDNYRASIKKSFDEYRLMMGWPWLELRIDIEQR